MTHSEETKSIVRNFIYHFLEMYRNWANTDINSVLKTKFMTADFIEKYSQYSADVFRGIYVTDFADMTADDVLNKIGFNDITE